MEIAKFLFARVVVRRVSKGDASFGWEIQGEETFEPPYVCPDTFATMEAAYQAGRARLAEFDKPTRMPNIIRNTHRRSSQVRPRYQWSAGSRHDDPVLAISASPSDYGAP